MKKKIFVAFIFIFIFVGNSLANETIRACVIRFHSKTANDEQIDEIMNTLTGVLANSKFFTLVERENLDVVGREQKMNISGLVDPSKAVDIGKLAGCQYIIMGLIEQQENLTIHTRVVNTVNGEVIFSQFEPLLSLDEDSIFTASSRLAYRILEEFTEDYPKVTNIKDGFITIDRGNNYGVCVNDLYRVYAEGNNADKFNSNLGRKIVNIAVIKIISVRENYSVAKIFDEAGNYDSIWHGDKVEPLSLKEADSLIVEKDFAEKRPDKNFIKLEEVEKIIAEAENGDSESQWKLGSLYEQGMRVKQSYSQAVKWYTKSAEQGNVKAQNNLGYMYSNGLGVPKDNKQEFEWYMKAAKQNLPAAQFNIAEMYRNGQYVEKNSKLAIEWYMKAAEQDLAEAQNALGDLYHYGGGDLADSDQYHFVEYDKADKEKNGGIKVNYYQAVKWYKKAANQGYTKAEYNLGMMYHKGLGVKKDFNKALEWYGKAADKGFAPAAEALKILGVARHEQKNYYDTYKFLSEDNSYYFSTSISSE